MITLTITSKVPEGLLDTSARDLHRVLDGPTLIELDGSDDGMGRGRAPLFVSGLMHGNEDAGLVAVQKILRRHSGGQLPRPLMILIGNVAAAREGMRRLDGQPDYNRVWPGCIEHAGSEEAAIMARIHARVIERGAFAAIDIHNNTGRNPHYGVICTEAPAVMHLASLFAPRAVLFRGLPGTQTASFTGHIPALTVECGQSGVDANAEAAARLVEAALALDGLDTRSAPRGLTLYHTLGQVRLREEVALARGKGGSWLELTANLDLHNFEHLAPGFCLGETNHAAPLEVIDEAGRDVAHAFFDASDGMLRLTRSAVPAMLTMQERIIRQDCLCYLMEEWRGLPPGKSG